MTQAFLVTTLLGLFITMSSAKPKPLRHEQSGSSLKILSGETLITEYRTDHHVPYLYPLTDPSGSNLTRHFPMKKEVPGEEHDHPHHRSFWLTHGLVNGHDFWHSPDGKSRIVHQSFEALEGGSFTVNLLWQYDGQSLLSEKRTYEFKLSGTSLEITFKTTLTAQVDVTFGDTKEGAFAMRVTPTLRNEGEVAKGQIINSAGQKNAEVWGKKAQWVSYYGPGSDGKAVVLTMMDHPKNLRHPTYWHARTYGLFAANPFGENSFTGAGAGEYLLKKGESLTQQYRVLVQAGEFNGDDIEKAFEEFAKK